MNFIQATTVFLAVVLLCLGLGFVVAGGITPIGVAPPVTPNDYVRIAGSIGVYDKNVSSVLQNVLSPIESVGDANLDFVIKKESVFAIQTHPIRGEHYKVPITFTNNTPNKKLVINPNDVFTTGGITGELYKEEEVFIRWNEKVCTEGLGKFGNEVVCVDDFNAEKDRIETNYVKVTEKEALSPGATASYFIDFWTPLETGKYSAWFRNLEIDPDFNAGIPDFDIDYNLSSFVQPKPYEYNLGAIVPNGGLDWNTYSVLDGNTWRDVNLVGYWNMDDTNGATAYDLSGNGGHANPFTCSSYVDGGYFDSKAFNADGSACGLEVPADDANALNIPYITVMAWVKPNDLSDNGLNNKIFISKKNETRSNTYELMIHKGSATPGTNTDDFCFRFRLEGSESTLRGVCSNSAANRYEWQHVVGTYDGSTAKIYVDGVVQDTLSVSGTINVTKQEDGTDTLTMGTRPPGDNRYSGLIDEVKIYDRALTESEIITDFNSYLDSKFVDTTPFDSGSDGTIWNSVITNADANVGYGRGIQLTETMITDFSEWGYDSAFIYNFDSDYSDLAGFAASLYPVGDATRSTGLWDTNALEVDGSGDWATVYDYYQIIDGTNATVSAWVYQDAEQEGDSYYGIMSQCSNDGYDFSYCNWMLFIDEDNNAIGWMTNDNAATDNFTVLSLEDTWEVGKWRHIVGTYNYENDDMALYVDGELIYDDLIAADASSNFDENFYVGTFNELGGNFDGKIEDTFLAYHELNADEVRELYRKGAWRQDLNVYSCDDVNCATKTDSVFIDDFNFNTSYDLSSLATSRYLGYDVTWALAEGLDNSSQPASPPHTGAQLMDINFDYTIVIPPTPPLNDENYYPSVAQFKDETEIATIDTSYANILSFSYENETTNSTHDLSCVVNARADTVVGFDGLWRVQVSDNQVDWNTLSENTVSFNSGEANIYRGIGISGGSFIANDQNYFVRLQHRKDSQPGVTKILYSSKPNCQVFTSQTETGVDLNTISYSASHSTASTSWELQDSFDINISYRSYIYGYGSIQYQQTGANGVPEFYISADINGEVVNGVSYPRQTNNGATGSGTFQVAFPQIDNPDHTNIDFNIYQRTTAGTSIIDYNLDFYAISADQNEYVDFNIFGVTISNTEFEPLGSFTFDNLNNGLATPSFSIVGSIPYTCSASECTLEALVNVKASGYDENSFSYANTSPSTTNTERVLPGMFFFEGVPLEEDITLTFYGKTDAGTITVQGGNIVVGKVESLGAVRSFGGGDGTLINPYQLTDCQHLQDVNMYLDANFIFNNDIDCNVAPFNTGAGFKPISLEGGAKFKGSLNGNGFDLNNLFVNWGSNNNVGLFSQTDTSARIWDLNIYNSSVTGSQYAGTIVGIHYGSIEQVRIYDGYVYGKSTGNSLAGGIAAYLQGGDIFQSSFDGEVRGRSAYIGGITSGTNSDFNITESKSSGIAQCFASTGGCDAMGGLIGWSNGTGGSVINDSYSTMDVNSWNAGTSKRIGGAIGWCDGATITTNVYASGYAKGRKNGFEVQVGGFCGEMDSGTINNVFATGLVEIRNGESLDGGLVGRKDGGTINNSFWDEILTDQNVMCGSGTGCDDTNGITVSSYFYDVTNPPMDDWNMDAIWERYYDYPVLQWQGLEYIPDYNLPITVVYPNCGGSFNSTLFKFTMTSVENITGANYILNGVDYNLTASECTGLNSTSVECQFVNTLDIEFYADNNFEFFGENDDDGNSFMCTSYYNPNKDLVIPGGNNFVLLLFMFFGTLVLFLFLVIVRRK